MEKERRAGNAGEHSESNSLRMPKSSPGHPPFYSSSASLFSFSSLSLSLSPASHSLSLFLFFFLIDDIESRKLGCCSEPASFYLRISTTSKLHFPNPNLFALSELTIIPEPSVRRFSQCITIGKLSRITRFFLHLPGPACSFLLFCYSLLLA